MIVSDPSCGRAAKRLTAASALVPAALAYAWASWTAALPAAASLQNGTAGCISSLCSWIYVTTTNWPLNSNVL